MVSEEYTVKKDEILNLAKETQRLLRSVTVGVLSETNRGQLNRIIRVMEQLESRLLPADLELTYTNTVIQLRNLASTIHSEVQAFEGSPGNSSLNHANNDADSMLVHIAALPIQSFGDGQRAVEELVRSVSDQLDEHRESAHQASSDFKSSLTSLKREANQVGKKIKDNSAQIANVEAQATERIGQFSSDYTETKRGWQNQIQGVIEGERRKLDSALDQHRKKQDAAYETRRQESDAYLAEMVDKKAAAEEIVAITAAAGMAGAYIKDADEQRKQADRWRLGVIVGGIIALGVGLLSLKFFVPPDANTLTENIFFYSSRSVLSLAAIAVVVFLARETVQQRDRERESKRLANELTTLRPFLSELTKDQQNEIVMEASRRYFPGHESSEASANNVSMPEPKIE